MSIAPVEKKGREPRKPRARRARSRRVLMKAGQKSGFLVLIQRVREATKGSTSIRKKWRVRCEGTITNADGSTHLCMNEITIPEMYLRRQGNPKVDCGCQVSSTKSRHNNEYRIWLMVRERTRNVEHIAHAHYSSGGINIIDEWYDLETGFNKFLNAIGVRPTKSHSVDRIDNKRGYEPGNVRWATSSQQRANQGDMVAGFSEKAIIAAGYTRAEFTQLVYEGNDEKELITLTKAGLLEAEDEDDDDDEA